MLMRRWTPPSQVPTTSLDGQNQRTFLRWTKVFIYMIIAITLVVFCTVYTIQKETFFNEEYARQQRDEQNRANKLIVKEFYDEISKLILTNSIDLIRTKTLMIIPSLTKQQKQDLLFFLYSQKLLENNHLNLQNADFNDIELFCSNRFHHINLFGVQLKNVIFHNCHFNLTNFQQTNLFNSQFINSTIENSTFNRANLARTQFIRSNIRYVDFTDATLIQSNFLQANIVQGNRFLNADLYQANLTNDQINGKYVFSTIPNDFTHARYPDGNFYTEDPKRNRIIDGKDCLSLKQSMWESVDQNTKWSFEESSTETGCALVLSPYTHVYHKKSFDSYSLLINHDRAKLSFDLKSNCDEPLVEIHMYHSYDILHQRNTFNYTDVRTNTSTDSTIYDFQHSSIRVPQQTQYLKFYLINQQNMTCYFANINLSIQYDVKV